MNTNSSRVSQIPTTGGTAQERNAKIDKLLKNLHSLRGVTAAVIVDKDGLVTNEVYDFEADTTALAASVQVVFGSAQQASEYIRQGATTINFSENKDGKVLLAPLKNGFLLALVADNSALLGQVRFEVLQSIPTLNEFFG